MAVRAATDGHNSIPPDGDEGLGSVIETATAVLDGQGRVLVWSAGARRLLGYVCYVELHITDTPTPCSCGPKAWTSRLSHCGWAMRAPRPRIFTRTLGNCIRRARSRWSPCQGGALPGFRGFSAWLPDQVICQGDPAWCKICP